MTCKTKFLSAAAMSLALAAGPVAAQSTIDREGMSYDGQSVVFRNVMAEKDGYLVVTEEPAADATASEPASVAFAPVNAGENPMVRVEGDFRAGTTYTAQLYEESNDEEGYQWGENIDFSDEPSMNDGMPVVTNFQIIMQSGEPESDG
ncbi:hypothetical protein HKCCE3408_08165 [Rhodobacterales bacterium HKCCE3408]|nr:hypothetical protein [Rhodobacterales bacterium HKCCE3408]